MKNLLIMVAVMLTTNLFGQTYLKIEKKIGETDSIALSNIQRIYFSSYSNGLVAFYPFEGSVEDASGNNNDGTVYGGVTYTTDRFNNSNQAIHLDGVSGYIKVPNSSSLQSPVNSITLAGWIYVESFPSLQIAGILNKTDDPNYGQYNLSYQSWSTPSIVFTLGSSGAGLSANSQLNLSQWYFLTAVYDGASQKVYLNGSLVSSNTVSITISPDEKPLTIGIETPGETEYFTGKLDDLRIYNVALNAAEIQALYHEGGWTGR